MDFNLNFHGNKKLITNKKLIKKYYLFKYYKNKIFNNGILSLEKTHSTKESEVKWKDEFDGNLYFSHDKSNSRGVWFIMWKV